MRKATKRRVLEFIAPILVGLGFLLKVIFYVLFGWLVPWLSHKANRHLVDEVKRNFGFLVPDSTTVKVIRADWPEVNVPFGNLLFTIVEARGDVSISVAPRHAPTETYQLGPLIAALEFRHFSERDVFNNFADAAKLLQPRLDALNTAFSEREFPATKARL